MFHASFKISFGVFPRDAFPLIVTSLAFRKSQLNFYFAIFKVQPEGDNRMTFFQSLVAQFSDFTFLQQ
jgi:hypothetical protein